jgi:thioredoxin-dependent peroxiredoxin
MMFRTLGMVFLAVVLIGVVAFVAWPSVIQGFDAGNTTENRSGHESKVIGKSMPTLVLASTQTPDVPINLADWKDGYSVFLFYPMDQTPGCTIQLCTMRDAYPDFQKAGIHVAGVNPADMKSHLKFSEKHQLPFPLLVDEKRELAQYFGVKQAMGTVMRTVVVVSPEQGVIWSKEGMPKPEEIMAVIKEHQHPPVAGQA